MEFLREWAGAVLDEETGELLQYKQLLKNPKYRETYMKAAGNEVGRLAQGYGKIKGTNTIFFIKPEDIPRDRKRDVTYGQFVCVYRPNKEEKERARLVVGGNLINYSGDCGTPTSDMLTVKLLVNSVISTIKARFMTIDIKNFIYAR